MRDRLLIRLCSDNVPINRSPRSSNDIQSLTFLGIFRLDVWRSRYHVTSVRHHKKDNRNDERGESCKYRERRVAVSVSVKPKRRDKLALT